MQISMTIVSTDVVTTVDGVPCRVWMADLGPEARGRGAGEVFVFVARVATNCPAGQAILSAWFSELPPPAEMSVSAVLHGEPSGVSLAPSEN